MKIWQNIARILPPKWRNKKTVKNGKIILFIWEFQPVSNIFFLNFQTYFLHNFHSRQIMSFSINFSMIFAIWNLGQNGRIRRPFFLIFESSRKSGNGKTRHFNFTIFTCPIWTFHHLESQKPTEMGVAFQVQVSSVISLTRNTIKQRAERRSQLWGARFSVFEHTGGRKERWRRVH